MAGEPTIFGKPVNISRAQITASSAVYTAFADFDAVIWSTVPVPSRLYNGACKILGNSLEVRTCVSDNYKDFELGYTRHLCGPQKAKVLYFLPCWKRPWDWVWEVCCVGVNTSEEIPVLARQCIDYLLVVRAIERTIGRRLESHELPKPEDLREFQKETETPPQPVTA